MEAKDRPMVSVIVTIYNREIWIEKCVERLISEQTFQDFEILLVDNGSIDNSVEKMKKCCKKYPDKVRMVLPDNGQKGLPSDSRQRGIDNSLGKYFTFCDSDDRFVENGLQILVEAAEKNEADMVVGNYSIVDENGSYIDKYEYDINFAYGDASEIAIYNNCMCQPRLFNLEFAKNNNIKFPRGKYFEDTCFTLEFNYVSNNTVVLGQIVYEYMINPESITHKQKIVFKYQNLPIEWFDTLLGNYVMKKENKNTELFKWKVMSIIMEIVYNPIVIRNGVFAKGESGKIAKSFRDIVCKYNLTDKNNPYYKEIKLRNIVGKKYFYSVYLYKILVNLKLDVVAAKIVSHLFSEKKVA